MSWFWNSTLWNVYFALLFLPSFLFLKFHVRKGKLLYVESSWKEKFPSSPISIQPLSARNSKLFPFIGSFTWTLASPSPRPRPPFLPAGSRLRCFTRRPHVRNLLYGCFFWVLRKKIILWSVKTFLSTKFKGTLLVHCIICVKCPKKLNSSLLSLEQTDKQTGSFHLWFWNNAFHWSFKKKSNPT